MIFKGKHRKSASFSQLLRYLMDDKGRGIDESTPIITHNVRGSSAPQWVAQLEANESLVKSLRKNRIRVVHEIISFHDKDRVALNTEMLVDIAYEYIKKRNPEGMYVIIPHLKDEHIHMHVCASPWEFLGGASLRLSKDALAELKRGLEAYQKERYPELIYSRGNHGKMMSRSAGRDLDNVV